MAQSRLLARTLAFVCSLIREVFALLVLLAWQEYRIELSNLRISSVLGKTVNGEWDSIGRFISSAFCPFTEKKAQPFIFGVFGVHLVSDHVLWDALVQFLFSSLDLFTLPCSRREKSASRKCTWPGGVLCWLTWHLRDFRIWTMIRWAVWWWMDRRPEIPPLNSKTHPFRYRRKLRSWRTISSTYHTRYERGVRIEFVEVRDAFFISVTKNTANLTRYTCRVGWKFVWKSV